MEDWNCDVHTFKQDMEVDRLQVVISTISAIMKVYNLHRRAMVLDVNDSIKVTK